MPMVRVPCKGSCARATVAMRMEVRASGVVKLTLRIARERWQGQAAGVEVEGFGGEGTGGHFIGHPGLSSPSSCARQTESWRDRVMQRERPGGQSSMTLSGNDSVASTSE